MQFLKVLGLLIFLVTSNQAFAIAFYDIHQEDSSNSPKVQEELQDLGESILTGSSSPLAPQPISAFRTVDFVFRGFNYARKANEYIRNSVTIKPGLDIQKTIFPFHTFL